MRDGASAEVGQASMEDAKLDPEFAEAYNNRSIARRIAGQAATEDEDWADALTMHDLQAQMRLRQQRKWMCIGYSARGEPEGEKTAADADFLISFASPDREENNRILHKLKMGVYYKGSKRLLPLKEYRNRTEHDFVKMFATPTLALPIFLFEQLRTGDLLHRQVAGDGAPHQRRARDETLEPDFFGPGSSSAARRISSLVQALQKGCKKNKTWTPHSAADGFLFEESQLS